MKTNRILTVAVLAAAVSSPQPVRGECSASKTLGRHVHRRQGLGGVASGADNFKTLIAAVKAAGLVETLQARTVHNLCSDDAAFAKLPAGTVESLLSRRTRKARAILTITSCPAKCWRGCETAKPRPFKARA